MHSDLCGNYVIFRLLCRWRKHAARAVPPDVPRNGRHQKGHWTGYHRNRLGRLLEGATIET
jgi:hypothetical protein